MTRDQIIAQLEQRLDLWRRQIANRKTRHRFRRDAMAKAEELRVVLQLLAYSPEDFGPSEW